jgi:D-alanyl-D-alanine carboxypeptidase/D-alanyl-D-alanine-endopeptidase (penicillin-binding protein 4)
VHKPAGLFAELFSKALEKHGIRLAGTARLTEYPLRTGAKANPQRMIELGAIESPPIKDITRDIQKLSLNLDTDLLLAHVGEIFRKPQDPHLMTSEQLGIRELKRFLAQTGIEEDHCFFEEGSGLSRNTLVTPSATTALLAYMSRHKHAAIYLDTLPVAGVDGSLQNRMNSTPAAGNLRAKTGTLKWATALSGIVKTAAGERLVFSFMLNRYAPAAGKSASEDLDQMAGWLASLTQKSSGP